LSQQNTSFSGEFELGSPKLAGLITYPHFSEAAYSQRLDELRSLGVSSLILGSGNSTINGFSICGKGCVGLVFRARTADGIIALKIRRTDADRSSMEDESRLHQVANSAGVGPRYLGHTRNLIAMEFVGGSSIIDWIGTTTRARFQTVARSVLDQCYLLDKAGLDHGELSRLGRHVIVSHQGSPCIVDFESASTIRKTVNVSSAVQSLFLYGAVAGHVKKIRPQVDSEKTIAAIRNYKKLRSRERFDKVVETLAI
jgi:putative serine/threonine protein kinase